MKAPKILQFSLFKKTKVTPVSQEIAEVLKELIDNQNIDIDVDIWLSHFNQLLKQDYPIKLQKSLHDAASQRINTALLEYHKIETIEQIEADRRPLIYKQVCTLSCAYMFHRIAVELEAVHHDLDQSIENNAKRITERGNKIADISLSNTNPDKDSTHEEPTLSIEQRAYLELWNSALWKNEFGCCAPLCMS